MQRTSVRLIAILVTGALLSLTTATAASAGGGGPRGTYQSYSYYGRSSADLVVRSGIGPS